jgi:hypothetical protein
MGRPPIGKAAMTSTERSRRYRAGLATKPAATKPSLAPDTAKDACIRKLEVELERERVAHLKTLAKFERAAETAKKVVPHLVEASSSATRIAELEAELERERAARAEFGRQYWAMRAYVELRTEGVFTRKEFKFLRRFFHPDRAQSEAEQKRYAEAFAIFSRCEKLLKKEPLPPPSEMPRTSDEWAEARIRVLKQNRERGLRAAATRARKKPGRQLRHT